MRPLGLLLVLALPAWPREIPFQSLPGGTRMIGDVEYVALTQLVTALGGEVWEVGNKVIAILPPEDDSGIEVVLTRDRARALVNKGAIDLPVPPRFIEGECYVPVALLGELFPSIPRRMPKVLSFALSHLRDTALLRVELDTVTHFSSIAMTSTRFRVFIQAECRLRRLEPSGLVKALEINQRTGTELLITTTEPCYCRAVQDGRSILVRLVPRAPRRVRLIVLDPGHGGQDPGAVGQRLREKDATLDIARRLARRLRQLTKADVVLTRDRDVFVSLAERAHQANLLQADLFVSIHCNWAPNAPNTQGFETFFLSPARNDWERAVMMRENAALEFSVPDTSRTQTEVVGAILRDLAQNEFSKQSQELAGDIQASVTSWLRGKDRGVKQADFAVLRRAYMPAVLVECGFLSNQAEERSLGAGDYRERIAAAIANGVSRFADRLESKSRAR